MTYEGPIIHTANQSAKFIEAHNKRVLAAYREAGRNIKSKIAVYRQELGTDFGLTRPSAIETAKLTRLEMLYNEIDAEVKKITQQQAERLVVSFAENYEQTYYRTAFIYEKGVNVITGLSGGYAGREEERVTLNYPMLQVEAVEAAVTKKIAGMTFIDRMSKDKTVLQWKLRQAVAVCIAEGHSVQELAKRLRKLDDTVDMGASQAITTARTEMLRAYSLGQEAAENEAIRAGVKMTYTWNCALDGKTRPDHQKADGQVAEFTEEGVPFFIVGGERMKGPRLDGPNGEVVSADQVINCRCRRLALPGSFRPTQRAAKKSDGSWYKVNGNMNYEEWRQTEFGKATIAAEMEKKAKKLTRDV